MKRLLFPATNRCFIGMRWVNIGLRTMHLFGMAGASGTFLYHLEPAAVFPYLQLTLISGALMSLLAIWSNGTWLLEVRGVATMLKLLLLGIALTNDNLNWNFYLILVVIVIAGIVSHAPGSMRYYRVIPQTRA